MDLAFLAMRLFTGYQWLKSAREKLADPEWMATGQAVQKFWQGAVDVPKPPARPRIYYGWYRELLQAMLDLDAHTWLAPAMAVGQLGVGLGLLIGGFTRAAAFFGALMNLLFLLTGMSGNNPLMLTFELLMLLSRRSPGRIGLDGLLRIR